MRLLICTNTETVNNNWIVCWERRALAWPGVVINKPIGGAREEEGGANACT